MKKISLFFMIATISLFGSNFVSVQTASAQSSGKNIAQISANAEAFKQGVVREAALKQRQAELAIPLAASPKADELPELEARRDRIAENPSEGPTLAQAFVIHSTGNTFTGLTVHGYNSVDLPEGTIVSARKRVQGLYMPMTWYYIGGVFPAGQFRYELEDSKKATYNEYVDNVTYEITTFFPNGSYNFATLVKPVNKYWTGLNPSQKVINRCTASMTNQGPQALIYGTIVGQSNFSIMVKDPDMNYDQWKPTYQRQGNKIVVNLLASGISIGHNSEVTIIGADADGVSGQCTVVVE